MKYIRTKDGIYTDVWWEEHYKELKLREGDSIKLADTIEELCDAFVLETEGKITTYDKAYFTCFNEDWYHNYLKAFDYGTMLGHEVSVNGYGAIHIKDKGLIYVAKMNGKGELELL